jgi:hypothetical protein
VLVFYKSPRAADSQVLVKGLLAAGFQASAIATGFTEAPQLSPDGSTAIVATPTRGAQISQNVEAIAKEHLPNVSVGSPWPLKRGDVQVFLY